MLRSLLTIGALVGLTACGDGNPFVEEVGSTGVASVNGTELDASLTANGVVYNDNGTPDIADDTLQVNNIAFDNSDATGGGYTFNSALPNGFSLYENPSTSSGTQRQFFAVFRRATHTQAAAIGTNDYIGFGFGGLTAERLGDGSVPTARPERYTFTGQYAGVRVYRGNTFNDIKTVTGEAVVFVDILDFDETGAVEGIVRNRTAHNLDGSTFLNLDDFISLATAEVNLENATINQSTAVGVSNTDPSITTDGQWSGVFGGPNGEEIAGIVVVEGGATPEEVTAAGGAVDIRENGAFIVFNGG